LASLIATVQASPCTPHQDAPACWERPANQPASAAENVPRNCFLFAALILRAAVAYSSQVFGGWMPSFSKTSER
jgi:hypothetical protein